MTAATYDFNLDVVQSSASSMIVELQPDTTSATPGTDGRWQGGTRPRLTLNWAANVKLAQGTVNTAPNAAVDGPADYVWRKISSTPSDLTLDTSALPRVRITDDDTAGGANTTVYGPTTTADTGVVPVGSANMLFEHPYMNARVAGTYLLGLDVDGNGVAFHQLSDTQYQLRRVTAGSFGDPLNGADPSVLGGSGLPTAFDDGDILGVSLRSGFVTVYRNGVAVAGAAYPYNVSTAATGTNARYVKFAGTTVPDLKIVRLA